jgi:hypothetical protein
MKKQSKFSWKTILVPLILGGVGALGGYFGGIYLKSAVSLQAFSPHGAPEKISFIAIAFFAIWFAIAVHELGHLSAGLAQGFRIALYTAGFLGIRGTERGVRFFFNRQFNLMGGLAATFPEKLESGADLRRKFIPIVAAGPISSLLLSISAGFLCWYLLQNPDENPSLMIRASVTFLLFTTLISGFIFLATMIPTRAGGFMSDGARLISLINGGEKGRYEEASLAVTAYMGAGKLPSEYPAELLARLTSRSPDSLLGLNGHYIAFTHHLDRGEAQKALPLAQLVQENILAVPAAFQWHYLKDVVFFYALQDQYAASALACWDTIQKQAEANPDSATYRCKAALALMNNQAVLAIDFVEKGLAMITDNPFEGQRRFEEKWLGAVLKQAKEQIASSEFQLA